MQPIRTQYCHRHSRLCTSLCPSSGIWISITFIYTACARTAFFHIYIIIYIYIRSLQAFFQTLDVRSVRNCNSKMPNAHYLELNISKLLLPLQFVFRFPWGNASSVTLWRASASWGLAFSWRTCRTWHMVELPHAQSGQEGFSNGGYSDIRISQ